MCDRPGHGGANAVGRGVLSMQGLSYGVVRVDQENSLTSLTLQDCGQVLPGGERLSKGTVLHGHTERQLNPSDHARKQTI